jgi:hypothetical protein
MGGRVYDPAVGRFLSVDPAYQAPRNSQSVNPYSYVMNNPLSLVDPSGYCASATDNENDANPTVCGTGNDEIGASIYNGHNGSQTGSHIGGHTTGIEGGDASELKTQQFGRFFGQLQDAVHAQYGQNTSVLAFGRDSNGEESMAIGNGALDAQSSKGTGDNGLDPSDKGSIEATSSLSGSTPGASRLTHGGTTASDDDVNVIEGMKSRAVWDAFEAMTAWKASGNMGGAWANTDPTAIFRIRFAVDATFMPIDGHPGQFQTLATCSGTYDGCALGAYQGGSVHYYAAAMVAMGQVNLASMTHIALHEFEHSTSYNNGLYQEWSTRNGFGADDLLRSPYEHHDDLPWEKDAIEFSSAAMGYYHP